ncbi:MAG: hypothetical protein NTU98_08460 [Bacteroidetes bacterium]|nr:hypothetical protein [Bacteroidota bacterium]
MKKTNFLWMSAAFVAGSVFGIALLGLVSFSGPATPPAAAPAIVKVDSATAKSYYQNYIRTAQTSTTKVGGFAIDKDELTALTNVLADYPTLSGFRIYLGIDGSGRKVVLVIGTNAIGTENGKSVYSAVMGSHVGPCPPICDVHSPISGN